MSHLSLIEPDHDRDRLDQSLPGNSTVAPPAFERIVEAMAGSRRDADTASTTRPGADTYPCPGEPHPVSRSVHLARLASGYSACQNCLHRHDHGALPCSSVSESRRSRRSGQASLITAAGIRGVYLNDIDRTVASAWGAAFASILWDSQPRHGRPLESPSATGSIAGDDTGKAVTDPTRVSDPIIAVPSPDVVRRGPAVVIGFDERPSSPDVVVGVALGLRRMGCHVIDLGQTTGPCFQFAVQHLEAAGGVLVTGSGCDPSGTGFNFVGRNAIPWVQTSLLEQLESRVAGPITRPTRTAGSQRSFHAAVPYAAGLWKFFHALRPLQVVCGVSTRLLPRTLELLFARLPCGLVLERLPVRQRALHDPGDADVRRVAASVTSGQKHLGLIVDDDGECCAFITENGRLISPVQLAQLLITLELRECRSARVVVDPALSASLETWVAGRSGAVELIAKNSSQLAQTMMHQDAALGFTSGHRTWFRSPHPICDSILVLARVLQALSLSDAPMSEVLARAASV